LTNFLDEKGTIALNNGTPVNFYATTLGTVTGDLRGAIGVYALSQVTPGQPVKVRHHWVTEAGDTIFLQDASAPTFPIPNTAVIATVNYVDNIVGGTGRFARASGSILFFGGVDLSDPANPAVSFAIAGISASDNRSNERVRKAVGRRCGVSNQTGLYTKADTRRSAKAQR
jgi:hypothetical protein